MADDNVSLRRCDVIELLIRKQIPTAEIHQRPECVYGNLWTSASSVRRWMHSPCAQFVENSMHGPDRMVNAPVGDVPGTLTLRKLSTLHHTQCSVTRWCHILNITHSPAPPDLPEKNCCSLLLICPSYSHPLSVIRTAVVVV